MKPLFVLLGAFGLSLLVVRYGTGAFDYSFSGRIAMSVMLAFTAMGHFAFTKGMTLMVPDVVPLQLLLHRLDLPECNQVVAKA
ncbi:MAG TPA: hypothetical protein VF646_04875 [Cytophagales bacterium]|jgi:hypothetical protein